MKKRVIIRIISFISAVSVVFAASGLLLQRSKAAYEDVLGRVRLSGLTSLCEYAHDISSSLRLLAVSSDENASEAASLVYAKVLGAQGSITCFENVKTENISAFLSGVAAFSQGFSDNKIDSQERESALMFSDYAQEMYYHLSDVANAVINGEYSLFEAGEIYSKSEAEFFENNLDFENGAEQELFSRFASASVLTKTLNTEKESLTFQEAKKRAADFLGIQSQLLRENGAESLSGIQTYKFSHDGVAVNVCRYGGEICRFVDSHLCVSAECTNGQARKKAEEMMRKNCCEEFETVFSRENNTSVEFVFAPVKNGVLILTASVKTEVCCGECRVISFDAADYFKSNPENVDNLAESADISGVLPENLLLLSSRVCYAEIDGKDKYCYFAECLLGDEKVFVFIDYYTLKTVKAVFA